ncbi:MAG: ABC transporter permease [Candidatus Odinarchaeia archaeon]
MALANFSLRAIKRRKTRAALTILCVVIGVAVFSGANVGADGVESAYVRQLLSTFGDVDITLQNSSSLYFVYYNQSLINEISSIQHITAVAPRIAKMQTFWFNGTPDNQIYLYAIDPELDSAFGEVTPSDILNQLKNNNSIINKITFEKFNLSSGDVIRFYDPFIPVNVSVTILQSVTFSGKFVLEKSQSIIVMNISDVQKILSIPNQASEIVIKVDDYRNIDGVLSELESRFGNAFNYYSQKKDALERSSTNILTLRASLSVFAGISLAVTAVLIVNVMFMNINERKRDLGIMRAIGASKLQIFSYVLIETIIYGIVGSIIGTLSSILLSNFMLQFLGSAISTIATLGDIVLVLNPFTILTSFILGVLFVALSGIYPALSAAKINILETIRPRAKGISKKRINKIGLIFGLIFIILGSLIPIILGPNILLSSLFIPTQLGITALITGGLILIFASILLYVAKTLGSLFSPILAESKIIIHRNVARNRKRSSLMFTMVTLGIVFVIFFSSLAATFTATFTTVIRVFTGSDIKLTTNTPIPYNFTSTLNLISGVQDSTPSYEKLCSIKDSPDIGVGLIFINSSNYLNIFPQVQTIAGASATDAFNILSSENRTIILSDKLLENLSLSIGNNITLIITPEAGVPTEVNFTIVATIDQFYGYPQYMFSARQLSNLYGAFTDISQLEDLINVDQVKTFFIKVESDADQLEVKEEIELQLTGVIEGFSVISAKEWEMEISDIISEFTNVVYFFIAFSLIVAGIGLATTMIVAVSERKQEIGILKALGMSKSQILKMVMGEGVIITIIGLLVGIGGGIYLWFLFLEFIVLKSPRLFFEVPFVIPIEIIVVLTVVCVLIALIASFYPAYKAMKMEIVDAIRKE